MIESATIVGSIPTLLARQSAALSSTSQVVLELNAALCRMQCFGQKKCLYKTNVHLPIKK